MGGTLPRVRALLDTSDDVAATRRPNYVIELNR